MPVLPPASPRLAFRPLTVEAIVALIAGDREALAAETLHAGLRRTGRMETDPGEGPGEVWERSRE
jgi:hypothetical protein